jgi:hypothetical protein
MKKRRVLSRGAFFLTMVLSAFLSTGCVYEVPVMEEHTVPVDTAVLGHWESVPDDPSEKADRMLVLKYSDTEYLVHYPTGEDGMYFRAYGVRIGELSAVQIELIGTHKGPLRDKGNRYHLLTYSLDGGRLTIKTLNSDLISEKIGTSAELRDAIGKQAGNPDLFTNPGVFRKVTE